MAEEKYRGEHLRERKRWKQRIANGERPPCARCTRQLEPDDAATFHLDHDDDGVNYLGPSHAVCNVRAAGKKAQRLARLRVRGPARPQSQDW